MDIIKEYQQVKYQIINYEKQKQNLTFNIPPNTDIVPKVYEGGFKLWECTFDLMDFIQSEIKIQDQTVIDAGCGYGLLGILALKHNAKKVYFQDYNQETYEIVLKKQLELNELQNNPNQQFISGDWGKLDWKYEKVDMILASEVIYREENYQLITDFILKTLNDKGKCIMINKNYYFGVGGSVEGYKQFIEGKLQIEQDIDLSKNKKKSKKSILILKKL